MTVMTLILTLASDSAADDSEGERAACLAGSSRPGVVHADSSATEFCDC